MNCLDKVHHLPDDLILAIPLNGYIEDDRTSVDLAANHSFSIPTSAFEEMKGKYLMCGCHAGLGNRLRILAGYKYVAEHRFHTPYLVMVWDNATYDLTGNFEDIFEPIKDVYFINPKEASYYEKYALKRYHGIILFHFFL